MFPYVDTWRSDMCARIPTRFTVGLDTDDEGCAQDARLVREPREE